MRNIKYTVLALLLAGFASSCGKDDLELVPISSISEEQFFNNDSDILGAVIAIYDGLQAVPLREFTLTEMRSDNAKSNLGEGEFKQLETFEVQPTNSVVNDYWSANYNVIYRANVVLKNIDVMADQAKKLNYIGEAKFARALSHFNLVRAFGDIPVIDKVIGIGDKSYFAKSPAAAAYALIESDLKEAIENLPLKSATTFGRASKQAAQGILAKVYMTQHRYSDALPLLTALVGDTGYSLSANYRDVFYVEKNNEILFAIPYTADSSTESEDFSYNMTVAGGLNYVTPNFATFMNADPLDTRRLTNINQTTPAQNGKWVNTAAAPRLSGNDWIVLRLADIYLMYTEAVMGTANSTTDAQAIFYYDKVRNRAFVAPVTSTEITKTQLLNQRRAELAYENQRLYDLIRFGQAETVLSAYSVTFQAPKDLLLPIPQTQINVSSGILVQNPLYN
ncbi:membrane protein [Flavobacterium noncentrifugens]|uniref:SusD family protein n=1 Tax=Flavobacterium noncentrifugens TaxID=1128970 RepID=A0A1G8Y9T3_9FLAO|nr:RagB/SusD family nutrient uptake outer membrane protein [Flavobacterium noncentrifugens]GEP51145.1 membrane protein [Flavobacterium noncentrifugens]SDJ99608.1 SusD family protein [Flavobacterium noncentrifugens]